MTTGQEPEWAVFLQLQRLHGASLDLQTSFLAGTPSKYLGQVHTSRSSGQGQGHRRKTVGHRE